MKNLNKIEQFADPVISLCKVLYGCDAVDIDIDMDICSNGISISVDLIPVDDVETDNGEISEEDIDKECAKHLDCCGCPYEDYCNEEDDEDE